jgi:IS5 family transposase
MDQVVPWKGLIALIEPHYPKGEGGRPAYPLMAMLRIHLMQNWFDYSDPAMEEALYETTILRQFSGLHLDRIPDETTILNFRVCWRNRSGGRDFAGHQRLSGRPWFDAAPGHRGRCDDHLCAKFDQEQGR